MNLQKHFLTAATATALFGAVSVAPAQAFTFSNSGILFDTDTTVNFDFLQSNGWWYGNFGVKNLSTGAETLLISETLNVDPGSGLVNDNKGTEGAQMAVLPEDAFASFTFNAGTQYSLFLKSYDRSDPSKLYTQYSTNLLNPSWYNNGTGTGKQGNGTFQITDNNYDSTLNGTILSGRQRALFSGDLFSEGMKIFFEDNTTWADNDFDDFVVSAKVAEVSVPEPATLAGLGAVAGAMTLLRRRKTRQAS